MAHILIVDDDPTLVELMTVMLKGAGHRISASGSGQEALKALGIEPPDSSVALPDLVMLDIMMPRSDGYTVGTLIRNNPRTRDLPILVVTALSEMSRLFRATVEVDGFLSKTAIPDSLLKTIAQILEKRKARGRA